MFLNIKVITDAIPDSISGRLIGLVTSREEIPALLKVGCVEFDDFVWSGLPLSSFTSTANDNMCQLDDVIDLVIPRGSNKLVSQIKESTKIPVLGHAGEKILHNCL